MKRARASDASRFWKAMKAGQVRVAILRLLSEGDMHGYGIMEQIRRRTAGFFSPTAGTIYPILQDLLKHGHVEDHWAPSGGRRKKRVYRITRKGIETLAALEQIKRDAEKMVQESLFKVSKILDINEEASELKTSGFEGMVGGGGVQTLLSRVMDARMKKEKMKLLKNARSILQSKVRFLRERERLVAKQIEALKKDDA